MQLLSHRGFWLDTVEKNQRVAFARSFDLGYGTETDVRDSCGKVVIAHDIPMGGEMTLDELLEIMAGRNLLLAINIKADGLAAAIREILDKNGHTNYFTFDMSIPDMTFQIKAGLKVYTGLSDILSEPVLFDKAEGIWLDSFNVDWWDDEFILSLLKKGKKVCVVSSDLHKRPANGQWAKLKKIHRQAGDSLMLCTDKLTEAIEYFGY